MVMHLVECSHPDRPHQYFSDPVTFQGASGKWWACRPCTLQERVPQQVERGERVFPLARRIQQPHTRPAE